LKADKLLVAALLSGLIFLGGGAGSSVFAEESAAVPDAAETSDSSDSSASTSVEIDADKRAAINELIEVTELTKRIEFIRQSFWHSAQRVFQQAAFQSLRKDPALKDASRDELIAKVNARADELTRKYQEMFTRRIDLDSLVKKVATDVYARHFSASEIRDIITFYKTPTGKKARELMPKIARESMIETKDLMKPELNAIVTEILAELKPATGQDGGEEAEKKPEPAAKE